MTPRAARTYRRWTEDDTATMERMAGQPDAKIAEATGHSIHTVRDRRRAKGIPAFQGRAHWTRRDWLLADAAGLDFQISLSVYVSMCTTEPNAS